jgi:3-oxoacyl-[acyl-carrier protein] reductase
MLTLKEKVAFVTGGTRGIGEAIVKRFAKEGANVAFTYVNSEDKAKALVTEMEQYGIKALAIKADSAIKNAVGSAVDQAAAHFGKLDILVNNAAIAIAGPLELAADNAENYDRLIDVNIRAVAEAVRSASKYLTDGGRIINIGSVGGSRIGMAYMSDYAASKAAVAGYTRGLAWDLAPRNITANVVEPGYIHTDMMPDDQAIQDTFRNTIPLKRFGKAEEVAALVNFIAGPESNYITGSTLTIDGGLLA